MSYPTPPIMPRPAPEEIPATVSSKGQVVIPGEIRRRLNLVQGSIVRFVVESDGVRLLPPAGDVRRLKGRLEAPKGAPVSVDRMNESIEERRLSIGARAGTSKRK